MNPDKSFMCLAPLEDILPGHRLIPLPWNYSSPYLLLRFNNERAHVVLQTDDLRSTGSEYSRKLCFLFIQAKSKGSVQSGEVSSTVPSRGGPSQSFLVKLDDDLKQGTCLSSGANDSPLGGHRRTRFSSGKCIANTERPIIYLWALDVCLSGRDQIGLVDVFPFQQEHKFA